MLGIVKTINGVKQLVPLTTDSGQGLPLGAWTSFEDDQPRNGYLKAGTTFNQADYPALYNMLGTNVVPERFDHNRLGDYESITISQSSSSPSVMEYDGIITVELETSSNSTLDIFLNGSSIVKITKDSTGNSHTTSSSFAVKKGDEIYYTVTAGAYGSSSIVSSKVAYYKHPMFIKAVIGPIEDSAADQVVQTINNANSYSTEEVNTGKTWIDGKPIYSKVYVVNATASTDIPTGLPAGSEVLQMWVRGKWNSDTSSGVYTVTDTQYQNGTVPFYTLSEDGTAFRAITSGHYVKDITIEYTKGTDQATV